MKEQPTEKNKKTRSFKDLIDTPFKKAMFVVQIISYVLIVGSPVIGGSIGAIMGFSVAKTGAWVLGIFIVGEVLFYGSLIFLGKEVVLLVKDKSMAFFRKLQKRAKKQNT